MVTNAFSSSSIIYISHEDMKWSFVVRSLLSFLIYSSMLSWRCCTSYLRYWCMKNQFHFQPHTHTYRIEFLFFPLPLLLLNSEQHIWVHFIKMFHVAALSVNAEREHPKLWKLKNLCAWATIFCTRSSASFITWIEKVERGP